MWTLLLHLSFFKNTKNDGKFMLELSGTFCTELKRGSSVV